MGTKQIYGRFRFGGNGIVETKQLNIYNIMKDEKISIATISKKTNIKYTTLREKLLKITEFKVIEALEVYKKFFKEYDFIWLFSQEENYEK